MPNKPGEQPLHHNGTWRTYTVADGLSDVFIEHISEDQEGYLWIATAGGGACRFDGDEFRPFTRADGLCGNQVFSIHLDRQHRLWFGTFDGGLCWYEGGAFHRPAADASIHQGGITFLSEDHQGRIWYGGPKALGYCDGETLHDLSPVYRRRFGTEPELCWGILQNQNGDLLFGLPQKIVRYDGEDFHLGFESEDKNSNPSCPIVQDFAGRLWTSGGRDGKLFYCDDHSFHPTDLENGSPIRKLQCDPEDRLWLCTMGNGAFCRQGDAFLHFTMEDGLPHRYVNAIHQDREGQIWFATYGGGLCCYDPQGLQTLVPPDDLGYVNRLLEDRQGRIWMTNSMTDPRNKKNQLFYYRDHTFGVLSEREGLDIFPQVLTQESQDTILIGGFGGVRRYTGRGIESLQTEPGAEEVLTTYILPDGDHRLFLGLTHNLLSGQQTQTQLVFYDGQHLQVLWEREEPLRGLMVMKIIKTRNQDLWFVLGFPPIFNEGYSVGGEQKFLGRWNAAEGISFYGAEDGLAHNRIADIYQDRQGILWIATYGGLTRFAGTHFENFAPAAATTDPYPQMVLRICQDRQGHFWFGSRGGVHHYDGRILQKPSALSQGEVTDLLEDHQGHIWLATPQGAKRYTPGTVPPRIRLTQISADQVYQPGDEIRFSSAIRQVVFEFKGLSLRTQPGEMLYQFRLLGQQQDWQPPTREKLVFYRDLAPDTYTFEVCAIDRDLNYSEPATVPLKVVPDQRDQQIDALEQRVRERTHQLEAQKEALEQALEDKEQAQEALVRSESMASISTLVAGAAHELNNPIGAAASLLQSVREMVEENTAEELAQDRETIVEHLNFSHRELDRARDIVASLLELSQQSQDYTEVVDLQTVVQDALRGLHSRLSQQLTLEEDYQANLPSVQGNFAQLVQAVLNLLGNAIDALGSDKGSITLKTYAIDGQVVFKCSDTGSGMSAAVQQDIFKPFFTTKAPGQGTGLGLYVCHQIVAKHGGSIEVESAQEKGATFKVRLPVSVA